MDGSESEEKHSSAILFAYSTQLTNVTRCLCLPL